ncbi:putative metallopeptidase [Caulobacter sp. SSI4214]|uniref:putative metallopeptidase n=1 Tax=Caulobacter sp. SSI4214 TaxID=2575739 RepID=UPI00143A9835|nr:putative metallopeptidase [Caulobacter sp. SSI4214]
MRPHPPAEMLDPTGPAFLPSPELAEWVRDTFLDGGSPLFNEEHAHLSDAEIGFLWTSVPNARGGLAVIGQCELMPPAVMGKWARARAIQQITDWFGDMPDFIITLSAPYCAQASDLEFMALVEHELSHAGQERDEFGGLKFTREGRPKFGLRAHDVQEFVGVVRRYGAVGCNVQAMIDAAKEGPTIGQASIAAACGSCAVRLAA